MKRFINLFWLITWVCVSVLTGCSKKAEPHWSGYAEGDYVYVSAPLAGRLENVSVSPGQTVAKDDPLFSIDAESERLAQKEATARLAGAMSQAKNLESGKRTDEIQITKAQLEQARATESLAINDLQRQQQLVSQGFVTKAIAEDAAVKLSLARARVAELVATLQVAQLPGRHDERDALKASAQAAHEALKQSEWRAQQKQQVTTIAAWVSDVFYQVGEFVQAGQPVVSLLPPDNLKARFFVSETDVGALQLGQPVLISCDGCGTPMTGKISRIATQPEFTPPVIYSNVQRSKLVFMVEAKPLVHDAHRLKPGQPLDVRLASLTASQGK